MNIERVKQIADAVLYEGYILYPYRASAIKNQKRYHFGTLYPAGNRAGEPSTMRTECLVIGETPTVNVTVRFLHLLNRDVFELEIPVERLPEDWELHAHRVASMDVDGTLYQTWQEAIEREIVGPIQPLCELGGCHSHDVYSFGIDSGLQLLTRDGHCVGLVRRSQAMIGVGVKTACVALEDRVFQLTVELQNISEMAMPSSAYQEDPFDQVLASTHIILGVDGGEFVSAIDPPPEYADRVAACENRGLWPVLAGIEPDRGCMLAAPIILYDYPQIASQSSGDFFDGTEIDEMLALRVMTMTDQEKIEMRNVDERARQILNRTESMSSAQMMNLHGSSKVT